MRKTARSLLHLECALVVFLSILLVNSFLRQSDTLTLRYFPTTIREDEPFVVTALVRNTADQPRTYSVRMFVDGSQVLVAESRLDASSTQSFSYTRGSPKLGSAVKIYAEALDLETGVRHSDAIVLPPSPPELWMSFAAFSSFATSLFSSSSSATSSFFTIRYYLSTMGISSTPQQCTSISSYINVGLMMSSTLVGLLIFLQLTDPSYGKYKGRLKQLRSRYGLLAVSLLLVFFGMVFTRMTVILVG